MLSNVTLPVLFFLISCSDCGKASAKRGSRQDSGKLVATLCHYYSDGAMGCKECFEVARTHRSNHNSTLLPPCKSVQGIKRRNWTLDDGILTQAVAIDTNTTTKRLTIASCAFYANKTFTCVATRPQCENLTQIECANTTSWSSRFEGSITDGFRSSAPHGTKSTTTAKTSSTRSSTQAPTTHSTNNTSNGSSNTTSPPTALTTTSSSSVVVRNTMTFGQHVSDTVNEIHKIPILEITTPATTRETKLPLTLDYATPNRLFTLTTRVTTAVVTTSPPSSSRQTVSPSSTEYTENCTETSCTIFAETLQPNITDSNRTANSRTTVSNATTVNSSNSGETLITLSPMQTSSTRVVNQTEELVTLTSHLHDSSLTSSTMTSSTTLAVPLHTDSNRTLGTVRPEPRKRHPIRRMY